MTEKLGLAACRLFGFQLRKVGWKRTMMKRFAIYVITVGVLIFAALTILDGFHIAEHSPLRAAVVSGISSGIGYLIMVKLTGTRPGN